MPQLCTNDLRLLGATPRLNERTMAWTNAPVPNQQMCVPCATPAIKRNRQPAHSAAPLIAKPGGSVRMLWRRQGQHALMYRFLPFTSVGILLSVGSCFAAPFDLIVPSEVVVRTQPGISGVGSPWGWVVATDTQLTYDQFQNANIALSTDSPSVTVTTDFNPPLLEPLLPGEVSGLDVSPFTDRLRTTTSRRDCESIH